MAAALTLTLVVGLLPITAAPAWAASAQDGAQTTATQASASDSGADSAPGSGADATPPTTVTPPAPVVPQAAQLRFRVDRQGTGWSGWKSSGKVAGNAKSSKRVERIQLQIANAGETYSGSVFYSTLMGGGSSWHHVKDGASAGVNGKEIGALKIWLSGDLAKHYTVWYRVNVQEYGWLGWAKNGAKVGTKGLGYRIQALSVKLYKKGHKAPGSQTSAFTTASYTNFKMDRKANKLTSPTKWLVLINTAACRVAVYHGKKGDWTCKRFIVMSCGKPSTPTKHGTYYVGSRGKVFGSGYSCWYWTQWSGNYLFHTVLYQPGSMTRKQDGRLGMHISHGCVRMSMANAKYIHDNVPHRTKVVSY
jgi:lipoprotein-anchoring transpeptidase ErfK/SrfK